MSRNARSDSVVEPCVLVGRDSELNTAEPWVDLSGELLD
jgi:hypothetical protein